MIALFVVTLGDIVGLAFIGTALIGYGILSLCMWIEDWRFSRHMRKQRERVRKAREGK